MWSLFFQVYRYSLGLFWTHTHTLFCFSSLFNHKSVMRDILIYIYEYKMNYISSSSSHINGSPVYPRRKDILYKPCICAVSNKNQIYKLGRSKQNSKYNFVVAINIHLCIFICLCVWLTMGLYLIITWKICGEFVCKSHPHETVQCDMKVFQFGALLSVFLFIFILGTHNDINEWKSVMWVIRYIFVKGK